MNVTWIAVATVSLLDLAFGAILGYASRRSAAEDNPVTKKIDKISPQSQCGQCGYPGCYPYAEIINCNGKKINRCVPDGEAAALKIAELLNVELQPLDGEAQELTSVRMVVVIDEDGCIGCTKCTQTYPADVVAGATRAMHTVMSDLCMGYNLCVDPYLTHCIPLQPAAETPDSWKWDLNTTLIRIISMEHHA